MHISVVICAYLITWNTSNIFISFKYIHYSLNLIHYITFTTKRIMELQLFGFFSFVFCFVFWVGNKTENYQYLRAKLRLKKSGVTLTQLSLTLDYIRTKILLSAQHSYLRLECMLCSWESYVFLYLLSLFFRLNSCIFPESGLQSAYIYQ